MSRRFSHVLAVAAAAFALAAPSALAAGSRHHPCAPPSTSAVNVYIEQLPTSCGSKAVSGKKPASDHSGGQSSVQSVPLPAAAVAPLKHLKPKIRKLLKTDATDPALGAQLPIRLTKTDAASSPAPSAVGAAFDLGSGPTALFAALLAAAALLALGGGLRRGGR